MGPLSRRSSVKMRDAHQHEAQHILYGTCCGQINLDHRLHFHNPVDASHALQIADIERILRSALAEMLALELAMGLLLGFGFLQPSKLGLGKHQSVLSAFGFLRLETLVHVLEVVALPHPAHASGRDRKPAVPARSQHAAGRRRVIRCLA